MDNSLKSLEALGQSIWLDYIRRDIIADGTLGNLIDDDGVCGMTSNPAIFEKAIAESDDYEEDIQSMVRNGYGAERIYETLSQRDVQAAADEFRPVYERTDGIDGYVSLEVNPHLAHDTDGTVEEGQRLWAELNRPNILIKVPATAAGLLAVEELLRQGININVTLLFGLTRYREVAETFMRGIEARLAHGNSVEHIASVASFFISRIDSLVDPAVETWITQNNENAKLAQKIQGNVAVASAKLAYEIYGEIFGGDRFQNLAAQGARSQRLLWASTSTKNPDYRDVKYIEALIGPDTVNTVPMATIEAFRDHGDPAPRLEEGVDEARWVMNTLPDLGIDMDLLTQQLEDEGVEKFVLPFDKLVAALARKRR
jgi:transaldolase